MNAIEAAAEAIEQNVGGWAPDNARDLDTFLSSLPRLFEALAGSLRYVADRLGSDFPVHPSIPEHLNDIASTVNGMSDYAGEAHALHRVAHAHELERIEEPRPGEQMWDVGNN
jgi:hypothetical protein